MKTSLSLKRGIVVFLIGFGVGLAGLVTCQTSALALTMRGEVISVKADNSGFTFQSFKPKRPAATDHFVIQVTPQTKFEKVNSVEDLRAGDEVAVNAEKNPKSSSWTAQSVRLYKVRLYSDNPAAAKTDKHI